ncbi:dependent outer membrane receptor [Cyanophage PSS2]|uniref:dependent outer membrane receptor n=1 Tax=Cyanophage PSS2 TaxID=658401 RepID=UPI0001B04030|nr:dependent outer membrane receptor [Cyanophage PSS2]ACT65651.1 dependent outer membrane receptor [Cyanophage PSS2]
MAYYFETIKATTNVSPALDKDTEISTFISHYLNDWATKVGSNYAVYESGHNDWVTKTSLTTPQPVNISLIGPPGRAGTDPDGENMGFYFYFSTHLYIYNYRGWFADAGSGNGSGDHRHDDLSMTLQWSSLNAASTYVTPRDSSVWYSDTPGHRYFAWRLLNQDSLTGIITELNDVDHIPVAENVGWAFFCTSNHNQFLGRAEPTSTSTNLNPWAARNEAEDYLPSNGLMSGRFFSKNLPTYNTAYGYMGHAGDTVLHSNFTGTPFAAVNYNASQYVNVGEKLWVKTS